MERGQTDAHKNVCGRYVRLVCCLLLTVSILMILGLLIYGVYQIDENQDLIDSKFPSANQSVDVDQSRDPGDAIDATYGRMVLEGSRLYNEYYVDERTYISCIGNCLSSSQCIAITYDLHVNRSLCYLFGYSGNEADVEATKESNWKSVLFVGKMDKLFKLQNTQIIGVERGFSREEDKTANASRCHELCENVNCEMYSHCECPDEEIKCNLFRFVVGFKQQNGTSSYFIPNSP